MVCGLVYLTVGRNVKFSTKTLHHTKFLLQKPPAQVLPCIGYCKGSDDKSSSKSSKSNEGKSKPSFSDGKSHLDYVIEQAKKGKISVADLTVLGRRVIAEGQFKNYSQAPQTVQYVALGTLIPMLGLPVLTLLSGNAFPCLIFTHLACGATILSFSGGSSWYEAITKKELSYEKLGWTIAPQIIGWTSLVLPVPLGILFTSIGFCLSIVHDVLLTSYPPWLKSLRLVVTSGTIISFALMFIFSLIL